MEDSKKYETVLKGLVKYIKSKDKHYSSGLLRTIEILAMVNELEDSEITLNSKEE